MLLYYPRLVPQKDALFGTLTDGLRERGSAELEVGRRGERLLKPRSGSVPLLYPEWQLFL